MKKTTFICRLTLCILSILFYACDDDEDFAAKYGSGNPLPENITHLPDYEYSYNEQGLVSQVRYVRTVYGPDNQPTQEREIMADITYPQSDRAVMIYRPGTSDQSTYVFAFGENHFANRIIETEFGESYLLKCHYDNEGHIIRFERPEEELKMEWTDGNLTKVIDDPSEYGAYTILTYSSRTDFATVKMNPFLTDVDMGPFTSQLNWWFELGLECALYVGFLGKRCVNLPATLTSYDNYNETPTKGHFEYHSDRWSFVEDYD